MSSSQSAVRQFKLYQQSPLNIGQSANCTQQSPTSNSFQPIHQKIQEEPSMLTKLNHSLAQRPSFQQLFLLEQEKKHLWELLALKEESFQKIEKKIKEIEDKNKSLMKVIARKDEVIEKLRENQKRLEYELKKMMDIKNNIVEEFTYIKKLYHNQQKQLRELIFSNQNKKNLKIPQTIVPQINTQIPDNDNKQLPSEYQQIEFLKLENMNLLKKNQELKTELDSVLKELRDIKVDVLEKFYLRGGSIEQNTKKRSIQKKYKNQENQIVNFKLNQKYSVSTKQEKNIHQSIHGSFRKVNQNNKENQKNIKIPKSSKLNNSNRSRISCEKQKQPLRQLPIR